MIIKEENPMRNEREKIRKIFEMLKDVKLPQHYKFVDDCVQIIYCSFGRFISTPIANIYLENNNTLLVKFFDEEDLRRLRKCFINSQTKFILKVEDNSLERYY